MFTTIQQHEYSDNSHLLDAMFRLRKRVFVDSLNWNIPTDGLREIDVYDEMGATYLVWCSDDRKRLYGSLRLLPTTGPTLLFDVFQATHQSNKSLIRLGTFEGTRMCVDEEAIAEDFPELGPRRAFTLLLLALCEAALAHGITKLVSNFEAPISRLYRDAGLSYELFGHADGYGTKPVYCAAFDVSQAVLGKMRTKLGVAETVLEKSPDFIPLLDAVPVPAPRISVTGNADVYA